jgi:hypothetical protein
MFLTWAEIALAQEAICNGVRHRAKAAKKAGENLSPFMEEEFRAALVAVTSAAFCLEAFAGELRSVPATPGVVEYLDSRRGKKPEPSDEAQPPGEDPQSHERVLNWLKASYNLDAKTTATWLNELRSLYRMRNNAVHFKAKFHAPRRRSFYGTGSSVYAAFTRESARQAVNTMLKVMTTCLDNTTPLTEPIREMTEGAVNKLARTRANDRGERASS